MECAVCSEKFNKSNRSKINCGFCEFSQCATCAERYILESSHDPHCMNCKTGWSTAHISSNFTQKFRTKDLKTRREELLFERERALMPAAQPEAERAKKLRDIEIQIRKISEKLDINSKDIYIKFQNDGQSEKTYLETMVMRRERAEMQIQLEFLNYKKSLLQSRIGRQEARQFIRCCPANDCKGFLSTAWKCGLCDIRACPQCHEIKNEDEDHVCLQENLETARLLDKDTRGCPTCAARIFKIDGCDQMWCTQCKTAFSWRTGRIETGRTHNPHYYDYLRQQNNGVIPREPGDAPYNPCAAANNYPDPHQFNSYVHFWDTKGTPGFRRLLEILRMMIHNQYQLRNWETIAYNPDLNLDIRIKYMIGDMTDEKYKKELQHREKTRNKRKDMNDVLTMYMTVSKDIFHKIMAETNDAKKVSEYWAELNGLREYTNQNCAVVSKCYKCVYPYITDGWAILSIKG